MTATADNTTASPAPGGLRRRFGGLGGTARLSGYLQWWGRALAAWLPSRLRALFGLAHDRLLLWRTGHDLRVALETDEGRRDVGILPLEPDARDDVLSLALAPSVVDTPRWLVLPADAGLRRRLVLPAAASERLRDVLAFELERQTPFAATDVEFDSRIAGRRADGQLDVDLVVVPRASLDAALAALGPVAPTLAGVDLDDGAGVPLQVNLLPAAQRQRAVDTSRGWNAALLAVAAIALAAGLWQVLANRTAAADAFEKEVTQRDGQARIAAQQERQLVDTVAGLSFLQRMRAGRPTMVEVVDELSRRLPDDTYLEKLSVENDQILMIGLSSDASSLVQRLEGSRLWKAPALTGALQPDPRTRRDRFTLTAQLAVTAPPQEAADARSDR